MARSDEAFEAEIAKIVAADIASERLTGKTLI
jgi:spore coat polysaccharide biosynthesis protein SpsF (cytidylyltransferase family)